MYVDPSVLAQEVENWYTRTRHILLARHTYLNKVP